MTSDLLVLLSKFVFAGSVLLVLYIVYFEWKTAKIRAEEAEIKLGEKQNEDLVDSLDDTQLINTINEEFSKLPAAPTRSNTKKPTR